MTTRKWPALTAAQWRMLEHMQAARVLCVRWEHGVFCRVYQRDVRTLEALVRKGYLLRVSVPKWPRNGYVFAAGAPVSDL